MDTLKQEDPCAETRKHIARVEELLYQIMADLSLRADKHDASKLVEPEASAFNQASSALRGLTYGSIEYTQVLQNVLAPAVQHHYENNTHHPEYWDVSENNQRANIGVRRMSLLDQLEMLADWKAAGERHTYGSLVKSLEINLRRFQIPPDQFYQLCKTAMELKWITEGDLDMLTMGLVPNPS